MEEKTCSRDRQKQTRANQRKDDGNPSLKRHERIVAPNITHTPRS